MRKFPYLPSRQGYSVQFGNEVVSAKLEGGLSRFRRDIVGASNIVNVTWQLKSGQYQYFESFYRSATLTGSMPFLLNIIDTDAVPTEREVYFVPGSKSLDEQSGDTYWVSAQLEVKPIQVDTIYDETLFMLVEEYGSVEAAFAIFNPLERLANVDLDVA